MALETDPTVRLLSPGVLARAVGAGVVLSLAVLALRRFAPGLLPAVGLLLAWTAALAWGLALAARQRVRGMEEERHRQQAELERSTREAGSLRRELDGYRKLFESRPAERKAPAAVPSPPPAPDNVHSIIRDPLTGLFHRRYFEASLEREIHRMERRSLPLGIILMEVDGEVSEAVLRAIGSLLHRRVRGGDVASRYDGGTFGLILPEAPLEGVRTRAEQLRTSAPDGVTLSLGVAAFPESGHSSAKLLRAVKDALEEAKAGGRDRVIVAPGAVLDRRLMLPD